MPCRSTRWLLTALGVLGDGHTCRFHDPAGTHPASWRRFLCDGLTIAGKESLPDDDGGVAVGMPTHLTGGTTNQGRTHCITILGVPSLIVPDDLPPTSGTVPAGVARVDPAGDD